MVNYPEKINLPQWQEQSQALKAAHLLISCLSAAPQFFRGKTDNKVIYG